jgi:ribosomal protein L44E
MPQYYCPACQLDTQHKVIMRPSKPDQEPATSDLLGRWLVAVFTNKRNVQLEKQVFCRECNYQASNVQAMTQSSTRSREEISKRSVPNQLA